MLEAACAHSTTARLLYRGTPVSRLLLQLAAYTSSPPILDSRERLYAALAAHCPAVHDEVAKRRCMLARQVLFCNVPFGKKKKKKKKKKAGCILRHIASHAGVRR